MGNNSSQKPNIVEIDRTMFDHYKSELEELRCNIKEKDIKINTYENEKKFSLMKNNQLESEKTALDFKCKGITDIDLSVMYYFAK